MKQPLFRIMAAACLLALSLAARADVWKWVDAGGEVHFVDTMRPIYTWVDATGKHHYADKPEQSNAAAVQLVWHSSGTLADVDEKDDSSAQDAAAAHPDETAEERTAREQAEAYYCKKATEAYDSYLGAPKLYRSNDKGEREYLSKEEMAATIADAKAKKVEYCH
jgi:Domain of unknown function (DUF4124)